MRKKNPLTPAEKKCLRQMERRSRDLRTAEAERWGTEDGANRAKTLADNPYADRWPWNAQRRAWNRRFIETRTKL